MAEQTGGNLESELAPVYRFWTDKAFILLFILAVLINLALLGAILNVFPQLPERLPILFNAQGQADLVANKVYLFRLPLGVLLLIFINSMVTGFICENQRLCCSYVDAGNLLDWTASFGRPVVYHSLRRTSVCNWKESAPS